MIFIGFHVLYIEAYLHSLNIRWT